jgi:hypothetical protein
MTNTASLTDSPATTWPSVGLGDSARSHLPCSAEDRAPRWPMSRLDAFSLVTSGQSFVPSGDRRSRDPTDRSDQKTYGAKGAASCGAQSEPMAERRRRPAARICRPRSTTSSRRGLHRIDLWRRGGRGPNADLLAEGRPAEGSPHGRRHAFSDPEAPPPSRSPHYASSPGAVTGSVETPVDRSSPQTASPASNELSDATAAPPGKQASNFLVVAPNDRTRATPRRRGPQLGYYYPESCSRSNERPCRQGPFPGWRCTSSSAARRTTRGA